VTLSGRVVDGGGGSALVLDNVSQCTSLPLVASASPLCDSIEGICRLAEAGVAAVVLPSLFEEQLALESLALHADLERGADTFAEAAGFFPDLHTYNLGPEGCLELIREAKRRVDIPIIASLNGVTIGGWLDYATLMQEAGADALIVSNHGGRQLDGAPSAMSVLPRIVDAVGDKLEVLMDGGIRSGQDVAKALAAELDAAHAAFHHRTPDAEQSCGQQQGGKPAQCRLLVPARAHLDAQLPRRDCATARQLRFDFQMMLARAQTGQVQVAVVPIGELGENRGQPVAEAGTGLQRRQGEAHPQRLAGADFEGAGVRVGRLDAAVVLLHQQALETDGQRRQWRHWLVGGVLQDAVPDRHTQHARGRYARLAEADAGPTAD